MQNQKIFQRVGEIETRTMLAERNAGRTRLPLNRVDRAQVLLRATLCRLLPAERAEALDLATIIRIECPSATERMARQHRTGEDRPVVDPSNVLARHRYFTDHAAYALAAMPHDEAAGMVQEVRDST